MGPATGCPRLGRQGLVDQLRAVASLGMLPSLPDRFSTFDRTCRTPVELLSGDPSASMVSSGSYTCSRARGMSLDLRRALDYPIIPSTGKDPMTDTTFWPYALALLGLGAFTLPVVGETIKPSAGFQIIWQGDSGSFVEYSEKLSRRSIVVTLHARNFDLRRGKGYSSPSRRWTTRHSRSR